MVIFLLTSNIFLSITASLGNILILIALHKVSSLHPPTKLLFRCLAVTDLCAGLVLQPLLVIRMLHFSEMTDIISSVFINVSTGFRASAFIFCGVSIAVSTAISVDRLLALLLGLRYRHVVTLRRVRAILTCLWLNAVSGVFLLYFWNYRLSWIIGLVLIVLCLVISVFSYTKIFLRLRQHQAQVQVLGQQGQSTEPTSYSTEHSEIQEDSFKHSLGVVSISCLLFPVWCCAYNNEREWMEQHRAYT